MKDLMGGGREGRREGEGSEGEEPEGRSDVRCEVGRGGERGRRGR
jgi:hypothetical protein